MRFYQSLWVSIKVYEFLSKFMSFNKSLWDSIKVYEFLSKFMRFYQSLWDSIKSSKILFMNQKVLHQSFMKLSRDDKDK